MINRVTHAHLEPIWYPSEPIQLSPIPQTSLLVGTFVAASYGKTALLALSHPGKDAFMTAPPLSAAKMVFFCGKGQVEAC